MKGYPPIGSNAFGSRPAAPNPAIAAFSTIYRVYKMKSSKNKIPTSEEDIKKKLDKKEQEEINTERKFKCVRGMAIAPSERGKTVLIADWVL